MTVVILVRDPEPDWHPLRYTLRTIPDTDEVTLVGGKPDWWHGGHVNNPQTVDPWTHIHNGLQAVVNDPAIPDTFTVWPSDTLRLNPTAPIPLAARPYEVGHWVQRNRPRPPGNTYRAYCQGVTDQYHILKTWGLGDSRTFDTHHPHKLVKANLVALWERLDRDHPAHNKGHYRILYGALFHQGDTPSIVGDCKTERPSGDWWSHHPGSWKQNRQTIEAMYPTPSRWELASIYA